MHIPSFIYVGFPTIISAGLLLGLFFIYRTYLLKYTSFRRSIYLASIQLFFAASLAVLSSNDNTSAATFWVGAIGLVACIIAGIIDLLLLIWWAIKNRSHGVHFPFALTYILLRLFSHITLTFQFCWCLMLCTV